CAILPGPRAGGRPSGAVALPRRRLSRRAGGGCDGPHRSGAASADVIRRHRALGRTSEQPLSRFALEAKYRDCAGRVLTPDAVDRSLDLVAEMETLDRASVVADTLAAGCACDQAASAGHLSHEPLSTRSRRDVLSARSS